MYEYQYICECSPKGYLRIVQDCVRWDLVIEEMADLDYDDHSIEMLRAFIKAGDNCLALNAHNDALTAYRHVFKLLPWDSKGKYGELLNAAVNGMCSATNGPNELTWECGSSEMGDYWQWRDKYEKDFLRKTLLSLYNNQPVDDEDMEEVWNMMQVRRFSICLLSSKEDSWLATGLSDDEIWVNPVIVDNIDLDDVLYGGFTYNVFILGYGINTADFLQKLSKYERYDFSHIIILGEMPKTTINKTLQIHVCNRIGEIKFLLWDFCIASLINKHIQMPLSLDDCFNIYCKLADTIPY